MASAESPLLSNNFLQATREASWNAWSAEVMYQGAQYMLMTASLALVFFASLAHPMYGVLATVGLVQESTIKGMYTLALSPLCAASKTAQHTDKLAQKLFSSYKQIENDSAAAVKVKIMSLHRGIFSENGFRRFRLTHREESLERLKPLYARLSMWSGEAQAAQKNMKTLLEEANRLAREASSQKLPRQEANKRLEKAAAKRLEAYTIEQTRFLPAKVQAAIHMHHLSNPYEQRTLPDFGEVVPMPLQLRALTTLESPLAPEAMPYVRAPDVFFRTSDGRALTREDITHLSLPELATRLASNT